MKSALGSAIFVCWYNMYIEYAMITAVIVKCDALEVLQIRYMPIMGQILFGA